MKAHTLIDDKSASGLEISDLLRQLEQAQTERARLQYQLDESQKEITQLRHKVIWQEHHALAMEKDQLDSLFAEYKIDLIFRAVHEISRAVLVADSSHQVLTTIIQQAQFVLEAAAGSILLMSADGNKLYFEVAQGEKGDEIKRQYLDINQGIGGLVARSNQSLLENNPYSNPYFNPAFDKKTAFVTRNILCVPMRDGDKVLGVLQVINSIGRLGFDGQDLRALELFARQAAFIILNQRLIENLHDRNKELQALSQVKSTFLATMSHEIRTPMTAVIGMTDLLLETELNEEQLLFVQTLKSSADFLLRLLNDILDFSKIEAEKLELEIIKFQPARCVSDLLKPFSLQAIEKNLALICNVSPSFPESLLGDAGRFRQVITNLVSNALKFTKEGEIVLSLGGEFIDDGTIFKVTCTVKDTGIGISEDKRELIFDSFAQADSSTTRQYGGTGLGLAISRSLARMMNGDIYIESSEGEGSIFYFTSVMEKPPGEVSDSSTGLHQELAAQEILLVSDNKTVLKNLEELLVYWGLRVYKATSTSDVFEMLIGENFSYNLVLIDFMKAENDGFTLTKTLRSIPDMQDIPILLLANIGLRGDAKMCRETGIDGYLVKPILPLELKKACSLLLSRTGRALEKNFLLTRHLLEEMA